jgi:hypothetical protein
MVGLKIEDPAKPHVGPEEGAGEEEEGAAPLAAGEVAPGGTAEV